MNATVPRDTDASALTIEEAVTLLSAKAKKRTSTKRKSAKG
jgi:topoisomerase IA-like protein